MHRDISASNILFRKGEIKVADLGVAKTISGGPHTVTGNIYYRASEIGTKDYNEKIDIYALGVLISEMMTLKLTSKENRKPSTEEVLSSNYSQDLKNLVLQCLSENCSGKIYFF